MKRQSPPPKCWNCLASARASLRASTKNYLAGLLRLALLACFAALPACGPRSASEPGKPPAQEEGALFRVGSIVVYESDLKRELEENHGRRSDEATRKKALDDLVTRAQLVQAALAANLDRDPVVRAQMARALASRLKEQTLVPRLKEMSAPVPEARLRELYKANESRYHSDEKRQVAVLWLNPGGDPERRKQYEEKLASAREFFFKNGDLKDRPEQGFSVLSVDHSEHAASRYKGGVVGWVERAGGTDPWSKAVAEIAFSLNHPGEVSAVLSRPDGVFLVRFMALQPAVMRSFENVSSELDRAERQRMRAAAEAEYEAGIKAKYPVQWLAR